MSISTRLLHCKEEIPKAEIVAIKKRRKGIMKFPKDDTFISMDLQDPIKTTGVEGIDISS